MKEVTIYTDGACSGNPGPGGYGVILMYEDNMKELSGGEKETTNNRMEMMGVIKGLEELKMPCDVKLYTDSAYIVNSINNKWLFGWEKKNFVRGKNNPVKNVDLWKRILELIRIHKVEFIKVKGHSDNEFNNRCDELAVEYSKKFK